MIKKICNKCNKIFLGNKNNLYCSDCVKILKSDVTRTRICIDCATAFLGGPRALRCPECRDIARKAAAARYRKKGPSRKIGSIDHCEQCGSPYVVSSGRSKYCSEACQRIAVLAWQRDHKKGYASTSGQNIKKKERKSNSQKICMYCGKAFSSSSNTKYCSDYCRKEQIRIQTCLSDIRRGYHRDIEKLYIQREEYRKKQD